MTPLHQGYNVLNQTSESALQALRRAPETVAKVIECVDSAATVSGHGDLSIGEVAKACEADGSQPV